MTDYERGYRDGLRAARTKHRAQLVAVELKLREMVTLFDREVRRDEADHEDGLKRYAGGDLFGLAANCKNCRVSLTLETAYDSDGVVCRECARDPGQDEMCRSFNQGVFDEYMASGFGLGMRMVRKAEDR